MEDAMSHLTAGAVVVYALQWLKAAGWCRWVTQDTKTLNRSLSAVAAALIAFGISATGDATAGWTISIPPAQALIAGVWEWVKQFVVQQLVWDTAVQKSGASTQIPQGATP